MDIDIILNEFDSPRAVAEQAALAESYGFRAVWSTSYATGRDCFLSLAEAATATSRILLGPLAVSPMELHPLKMMQQLLTLNELCNGRATITIGAGGGVLDAMNIKRKQMVESVRECVEIIRAALSGDDVAYYGDIYSAHKFNARWAKDIPAPRIYVGASQKRMSYMATEKADGLMGSDLIPPLIPLTKNWVDDGLAQHGRAGRPFGISNFWAWHIKKDKAESKREACRELVLRGVLRPRYTDVLLNREDSAFVQENKGLFWRAWGTGAGRIDGVPEHIVDALIDGLSSTGDMDDLDREIERFRAFETLGLTEIAIRVHDDPVDAIRLIGEHILPAVR
jgi:5,10-methylenetetrahydromethanopterin reductase